VNIHPFGSLLNRANTVSPVIVIRKASTRPSQNRDSKFFQIFDGLLPVTSDVWNRRVLSYPQTTINAGTQMFGKVRMKLRLDHSYLGVRSNLHAARGRSIGKKILGNECCK
jgi:hypothetical protein